MKKENIKIGEVAEIEILKKEGGLIRFHLSDLNNPIKLDDLIKVVIDDKSYYFNVNYFSLYSDSIIIKAANTGYYNKVRNLDSTYLFKFPSKDVILVLDEDEIKEFNRSKDYC